MISEFRVNKRRVRIFPWDESLASTTMIRLHPPVASACRGEGSGGSVEVMLDIYIESCSFPAVFTLYLMSLFVFNSCVPRPAPLTHHNFYAVKATILKV